jgi:phage terminase large subunit GpA-like protein
MSRAPNETLHAVLNAITAGLEPLRAVEPMPLSLWAEEHFRLSAESSHTQGQWQAYPFQKGWMDAFSNDDIEEVNVRKSKRVGYTKTLVAFAAYNIAHRRRKQAIWQPTDDDRDSFVKSEIDPMLRDVKAVQPFKLNSKEDTLKLKQFMGSVMHTLGGKAARAYRRITVAVAILDEASAFDLVVEKRTNPVEGARGRLEGAPFPKLIVGSTPSIKGLDHVETREQNAEAVMRYQIMCPHCGVEHPLIWGGKGVAHGFKGGGMGGDTGPVRHLCPHCRGELSQAEYLRLYGRGVWISDCAAYRYGQDGIWRDGADQPIHSPRHVAFVIWAAYSPQREWADIVREFLEAKKKAEEGESGSLITFVNETLGEVWEEVFEKADQHQLARRAEAYSLRTVPLGGLVLVCGVDVQDDRFEAVVWAIGRGEEMWVVDYAILPANPADEREWAKLDEYLLAKFPHAGGQQLGIDAVAVDTGGHFTHQAYNYCRQRERRRVYAVKGDHQPSKMVKSRASVQDVNWRGQILKRGVKLWFVGTDTAKDLLYGRLQVTQPGPGYVHFSKDLPDQFYEQMTVEARVPVRTARGIDYKWVNPKRRRNEAWDCSVYAIFCTHMLNLHVRTDKEWKQLEDAVQPRTLDLFAAATVSALADNPPPSIAEKVQANRPAPENVPRVPAPPAPRFRINYRR